MGHDYRVLFDFIDQTAVHDATRDVKGQVESRLRLRPTDCTARVCARPCARRLIAQPPWARPDAGAPTLLG